MKQNDEMILNIIELMKTRGFVQWNDYLTGDGDVIHICFKTTKYNSPEHLTTCLVYPHESGIHEFEFMTILNPGAILLTTNTCGPLSNEEHFEKQANYFIETLRRFV